MQNLQANPEPELQAGEQFDWDDEGDAQQVNQQQDTNDQTNSNREAMLRKIHMMRLQNQNLDELDPKNQEQKIDTNKDENQDPKNEPTENIEKDCFDSTEEIYSKLNWENLLFFKSACLFNKATLYEDDFLEIDVKTQHMNPNSSDELVVFITYINKTSRNMTLLSKVQPHTSLASFPEKVMHIFDDSSKKINHEIVIKRNLTEKALIPGIVIAYKIDEDIQNSFTICLPTTVNKFLSHETATKESLEAFLQDKKKLEGLSI